MFRLCKHFVLVIPINSTILINGDQVLPAEDTSTEPDVIASSKQETLEDVLVPPGPFEQV